jgi:opacity protein-like surface antigen
MAIGAAAAAVAGENANYVAVYGGYSFQNIQNFETLQKFVGPVSVDWDDSANIQVRAGHIFDPMTSIEFLVEYASFSEENTTPGIENDLSVLNIFYNAKLACSRYQQVKPYLVAGLGAMRVQEEITATNGEYDDTEWGIGSRLGLGLDYWLNDTVSVGLEGAYSVGIGGLKKIRYTTMLVGVSYHF